ncbi:uncharacterized protein BXZ73DRAFT_82557 [Epithele typhae]|uniref:uncharacterized protein n=1 Tax=Epithele typhae TaxID=378194 RepID=UPI00200823DB|nr:uncharacterized protein BXZ73DRAFT_82557 [Epithele typhae]KAH9911958.1 hypothetical protein BXZ73DRAFT_82557 [Epithele typhae]
MASLRNTIDSVEPAVHLLSETLTAHESRPMGGWSCTSMVSPTPSRVCEGWYSMVTGEELAKCGLSDAQNGLILQLILAFRAFSQGHREVAFVNFQDFIKVFTLHVRALAPHEPADEALLSMSYYMLEVMPDALKVIFPDEHALMEALGLVDIHRSTQSELAAPASTAPTFAAPVSTTRVAAVDHVQLTDPMPSILFSSIGGVLSFSCLDDEALEWISISSTPTSPRYSPRSPHYSPISPHYSEFGSDDNVQPLVATASPYQQSYAPPDDSVSDAYLWSSAVPAASDPPSSPHDLTALTALYNLPTETAASAQGCSYGAIMVSAMRRLVPPARWSAMLDEIADHHRSLIIAELLDSAPPPSLSPTTHALIIEQLFAGAPSSMGGVSSRADMGAGGDYTAGDHVWEGTASDVGRGPGVGTDTGSRMDTSSRMDSGSGLTGVGAHAHVAPSEQVRACTATGSGAHARAPKRKAKETRKGKGKVVHRHVVVIVKMHIVPSRMTAESDGDTSTLSSGTTGTFGRIPRNNRLQQGRAPATEDSPVGLANLPFNGDNRATANVHPRVTTPTPVQVTVNVHAGGVVNIYSAPAENPQMHVPSAILTSTAAPIIPAPDPVAHIAPAAPAAPVAPTTPVTPIVTRVPSQTGYGMQNVAARPASMPASPWQPIRRLRRSGPSMSRAASSLGISAAALAPPNTPHPSLPPSPVMSRAASVSPFIAAPAPLLARAATFQAPQGCTYPTTGINSSNEYIAGPDDHHSGRWHVVTAGTCVGIWKSYPEILPYVTGVSYNCHRSFFSRDQAVHHYLTHRVSGRVAILPPRRY